MSTYHPFKRTPFAMQKDYIWRAKGLLLQCKRTTFGGQKDYILKRRKILQLHEETIATSQESKKKPETKRFRAQTI